MRVSDERGTMMVEAAVILPVIILAVMAVIYTLIFMHRQVSVRADMHMGLWAEKGSVSRTFSTGTGVEGTFPVYSRKSVAGGVVYYTGHISFMKRGLLKSYNAKSEGRLYWIREKELIRGADIIDEEINE
ncbi:MAG: pilus assembly protein [Firmicutes bacterium]|nr:pilus assembly protein [Bacillota bacterium]